MIRLDVLAREQGVGDHARDHQVERTDQLQQAGRQHAFLTLGQRLGAKGALDDLLVGGPVKHVQQQDA